MYSLKRERELRKQEELFGMQECAELTYICTCSYMVHLYPHPLVMVV